MQYTAYTLYDGKLENNSSFTQCCGRVILHFYPKCYCTARRAFTVGVHGWVAQEGAWSCCKL